MQCDHRKRLQNQRESDSAGEGFCHGNFAGRSGTIISKNAIGTQSQQSKKEEIAHLGIAALIRQKASKEKETIDKGAVTRLGNVPRTEREPASKQV